jgi:hypothetical protein
VPQRVPWCVLQGVLQVTSNALCVYALRVLLGVLLSVLRHVSRIVCHFGVSAGPRQAAGPRPRGACPLAGPRQAAGARQAAGPRPHGPPADPTGRVGAAACRLGWAWGAVAGCRRAEG